MAEVFPDNCFQMHGKYLLTEIGLEGRVKYDRLKEIPTEDYSFISLDHLSDKKQMSLLQKMRHELSETYEIDTNTTYGAFKVKVPILKNVKIEVFQCGVSAVTGLDHRTKMGEKQSKAFKDVLKCVDKVFEEFDKNESS